MGHDCVNVKKQEPSKEPVKKWVPKEVEKHVEQVFDLVTKP